MRALELQGLDGPSSLELRARPRPPAGDGVLVDVHAAGVGFPDLLLSRGEYQVAAEPPVVPGFEVAGIVRAAPVGVGVAPGQAVIGTAMLGAFAEQVVLDPALVSPLPDGVDLVTGAALVSNYPTAHFALARRAALQPGETLVVLGAAGGLGGAAIAVGKALGARVIAIVRREDAAAFVRESGADEVLAAMGPWRETVRELSGGGADVVLDPVGGEAFDEGVRALARGGRIVVAGFASGVIPALKLNRVLLRNISVVGAAWGEWLGASPQLWGETIEALSEMLAARRLRQPAVTTYPLHEGARALGDLEQGRVRGKAVLTIGEELGRVGA